MEKFFFQFKKNTRNDDVLRFFACLSALQLNHRNTRLAFSRRGRFNLQKLNEHFPELKFKFAAVTFVIVQVLH